MKAATKKHLAGRERRKVDEVPTKRLDGTRCLYFPSGSFPPPALYTLQQGRDKSAAQERYQLFPSLVSAET